MSQEEMWAEISERRNELEQEMRRLCRMQLKAQLGAKQARETVLHVMGDPRTIKSAALSYSDLFDGNKSGILFSDLIKIINKHTFKLTSAVS